MHGRYGARYSSGNRRVEAPRPRNPHLRAPRALLLSLTV